MILGLFRRTSNETVIDRLYAAVVVASRHPGLYVELCVPDTFEGRFESLTLHAVIILRRLKAAEPPGPDMAQHLVDTVFKHFDRTLREMGVGDTTVPKRMKSMAEAFLGRSTAYDEALRGDAGALSAALRRNIYGDRRDGTALARYVIESVAALAARPLQDYVDGVLAFPDPSGFVREDAP
jgi:cytochrome b pre-mRNA-processing protein 3